MPGADNPTEEQEAVLWPVLELFVSTCYVQDTDTPAEGAWEDREGQGGVQGHVVGSQVGHVTCLQVGTQRADGRDKPFIGNQLGPAEARDPGECSVPLGDGPGGVLGGGHHGQVEGGSRFHLCHQEGSLGQSHSNMFQANDQGTKGSPADGSMGIVASWENVQFRQVSKSVVSVL